MWQVETRRSGTRGFFLGCIHVGHLDTVRMGQVSKLKLLLILLAAGGCSGSGSRPMAVLPSRQPPIVEAVRPSGVPAAIPFPVVEPHRLRSTIEALSRLDRFAGSPGERAAAAYIKRSFEAIGYGRLRYDKVLIGRRLRSANVICRKPGTSNRHALVIGAHYDAKAPSSPGATDNASGVSAVLEAARLLKDRKLAFDVYFVAFGGEERLPGHRGHHAGSRSMASRLAKVLDGRRCIGMINIDMACGRQLYVGNMGLASQSLTRTARREAAMLGLKFRKRKEPGDSDHEAFERRGTPVAYIHYWPAKGGYHSANDRLEFVDESQVADIATLIMRTALSLRK
jgi:Iap family predicted aminopeptidase